MQQGGRGANSTPSYYSVQFHVYRLLIAPSIIDNLIGIIDDPYNEFFVEEYGSDEIFDDIQRKYEVVYDTYWEKRYSLNSHQVYSSLPSKSCILIG